MRNLDKAQQGWHVSAPPLSGPPAQGHLEALSLACPPVGAACFVAPQAMLDICVSLGNTE